MDWTMFLILLRRWSEALENIRYKDLTGKRVGRLVVKEPFRTKEGVLKWVCICDCGNETKVLPYNLSSSKRPTKSCGCLQKEAVSTHGRYKSREYSAWDGLLQRCNNPDYPEYFRYGGRGISHDPRWKSFEKFYEDMGDCPEGMTLDRIDPDGNYCKENCRWADKSLQSYNTRKRVTNTSGRTGVSWTKAVSKWEATITVNYELIRLGHFESFEDAVKAREEAELKYFGFNKE